MFKKALHQIFTTQKRGFSFFCILFLTPFLWGQTLSLDLSLEKLQEVQEKGRRLPQGEIYSLLKDNTAYFISIPDRARQTEYHSPQGCTALLYEGEEIFNEEEEIENGRYWVSGGGLLCYVYSTTPGTFCYSVYELETHFYQSLENSSSSFGFLIEKREKGNSRNIPLENACKGQGLV